jgi:hypothetical protein
VRNGNGGGGKHLGSNTRKRRRGWGGCRRWPNIIGSDRRDLDRDRDRGRTVIKEHEPRDRTVIKERERA